MSNIKKFKKELRDLLVKYEAEIWFSYEEALGGIGGAGFEVEITTRPGYFEKHRLADGFGVGAEDLEEDHNEKEI